jgi:DNA mismatch endonuclease, patch repair protein
MDKFTNEKRSEIMSKVKGKDTGPELLLRKALLRQGLRYRLYYGKEKIDIVFPSKCLAIFVDGCFWHMCPKHSSLPKSNTEYWHNTLYRNVERNREKDMRLQEEGWKVVHVWEHEFKDVQSVAGRIVKLLDEA